MLLVIIGAGASHDSANGRNADESYRPPLAVDLFASQLNYVQLLMKYPTATPIVQRVRLALAANGSLEHVLEEIRGEVAIYPARAQHLLGLQFYLRSLLADLGSNWLGVHGGVTNYVGLADLVESCRVQKKESVVYVSFNYDTLLEAGLEGVAAKRFTKVASYIDGHTKVVKVHGSADWGQIVSCDSFPSMAQITPGDLCGMVNELTFTDGFMRRRDNLDRQAGGSGSVLVPAIAIPTQTKDNFACPSQHIEALRECLPQVRGVVTIGWRGAEEHFLKLLKEGLPPQTQAYVVTESRTSCEATALNLQAAGLAPDFLFPEGFTGLMNDDVSKTRGLRRFVEQKLVTS
jgi:hypothetical protein